jgi:acyl carrier protein
VLDALATILSPARVYEFTPLEDRDDFDSIALASFLDEIEARTGIVIRPDLVVPERFVTPRAIADALGESSSASRGIAG